MIDYRVRSISLLNLVNEVKSGRLIPDAYFQRNLVWREVHNKDFIRTILLGFPFPQIFISKGKVDVELMSTKSCIVDGQQRTHAIVEYIAGSYDVDGQYFEDLSETEKSNFLKYEIAVIELDLENDDNKVKQIFQRINRTSNALTAIEKMASEYSTSEFMLVAKLLTNQVDLESENNEDFREDPNIPSEFYIWARKQKINKFIQLITGKKIFTSRDIAKKAHLMHVLNIISTILTDFFTRNERTIEFLNDYADNFEKKNEVVVYLEKTAEIILSLKLKATSYWYNKSNIFSLIVAVSNKVEDGVLIDTNRLKTNLESFATDIPAEYKLAATEGVNNKRERELRNKYIKELF